MTLLKGTVGTELTKWQNSEERNLIDMNLNLSIWTWTYRYEPEIIDMNLNLSIWTWAYRYEPELIDMNLNLSIWIWTYRYEPELIDMNLNLSIWTWAYRYEPELGKLEFLTFRLSGIWFCVAVELSTFRTSLRTLPSSFGLSTVKKILVGLHLLRLLQPQVLNLNPNIMCHKYNQCLHSSTSSGNLR